MHLAPASVNSPFLGVVAHIKLLTAVLELLWAAVEAGKFILGAAQLYLLAQHVHTGLLADAGGQVTAEKKAQWLPVIARHWAIIQQLQSTLPTSCCQATQSAEQLSLETPINTIAHLMNYNLDEPFQEMLSKRLSRLSAMLMSGRTDSARSASCFTSQSDAPLPQHML